MLASAEFNEEVSWGGLIRKKKQLSRAGTMNDNVTVYSKLGKGTNVKITLPINESSQASAG